MHWQRRGLTVKFYKVGEIVRVDKDNLGHSASTYKDGTPRYWKITGRKFIKHGAPKIELQLVEAKLHS